MLLTPSLSFEQGLGSALTMTLPRPLHHFSSSSTRLYSFEKLLARGKEVDASLRDRLRCTSLFREKYLMLEARAKLLGSGSGEYQGWRLGRGQLNKWLYISFLAINYCGISL